MQFTSVQNKQLIIKMDSDNPEHLEELRIEKLNEELLNAIHMRDKPKIDILLRNGACIDYNSCEALHESYWNDDNSITFYLIEKGADINIIGESLFLKAVEFGDIKMVKYLVEHNVDIHICDNEAICQAYLTDCDRNMYDLTYYLIEKGADIHARCEFILRMAADNDDIKMVKYMLDHNANVHVEYDEPLRNACKNSCLEIVQLLVEKGANIHAENDEPLKNATRNHCYDIIKYLVERGANIHIDDDSPLWLAVENNKFELVEFLLDHKANIHSRNYDLLKHSLINDNHDMAILLIRKGANIYAHGNIALLHSASCGDLNIIKALIEVGVDIHANHDEALCLAAYKGHYQIVKLLVENGANVNIRDDEALKKASSNGNELIVKYLIENGANVNGNAMCVAAKYGHLSIVKILMEHKTFTDKDYETYMYQAAYGNHIEVVKFFVDNDIKTYLREDFFCDIAEKGKMEIIKLLIDKHTYSSQTYSRAFGRTCSNGYLELSKLLFQQGVDVNFNGGYAIKWAVSYKHMEIIRFLIENGADIQYIDIKTRIKLGFDKFVWVKKPDNIPSFRESNECPISKTNLNSSVPQLGCKTCLNVFEKTSLEEWLMMGHDICPMCRVGNVFYLVNG